MQECKKEKKNYKALKCYTNPTWWSLQGQLWGRHFLVLDFKKSTLSQRFNSDGTNSHILVQQIYFSCAEFRLKS